jgi:D-alanyl-D-alanine carboxypeptidase
LISISTGAAALPPYIVVDADSGQVLSARDPHQLWAPASLTKMMTAYLAFEAIAAEKLTLASPVKISPEAGAVANVRSGLPVHTVLPLEDALKIMLTFSANDLAYAVAEASAGTIADFVERMNGAAKRLGMTETRFVNPNGLPADGQVSSARDLAILSQALWRDFPAYHGYFGIGAVQVGSRTLPSGNDLLRGYRGTQGLKTGFTCASGYNLAALASRDGRTVIAVVLGATSTASRAELSSRLLERGFATQDGPDLASFQPEAPSTAPAADMSARVCYGRTGRNETDSAMAGPSPLRKGEPPVAVRVSAGTVELPPGVKPPPKLVHAAAAGAPRRKAAATAQGDAAAAPAEEKPPAPKAFFRAAHEASGD